MHSHLQTQISSARVRVPWNERIFPMGKKTTTYKVGRDAETGYFKPVILAQQDRKGSIVETITRPTNTHKPTKKD